MADDDGNNAAADDQYADDYGGEEMEDFSGYVPTSVDLGWWLVLGLLLFCMFPIVIVSVMLWRTRKKRKVREMKKGAAIAQGMREQGADDEDGESVDTVSSSDSSDSASVITEIEDDCDSITSTTVPIVDTMFACNGEEKIATVVKRNPNRPIRGRAKQMKRFFFDGRVQPQNGSVIGMFDTNQIELSLGSSKLSGDATGDDAEYDFVQFNDALAPTPPPQPQVDVYEHKHQRASDYHQMNDPSIEGFDHFSVPKREISPKRNEKHVGRSKIPRFLRFNSSRPTKGARLVDPPPIESLPVQESLVSVYSQFKDEVEAVSGRTDHVNAPPFVASGSLPIEKPHRVGEYHHLDDIKDSKVGSGAIVPKEEFKVAPKDMSQPESAMVDEVQSTDTQTHRDSEKGIYAYDQDVPDSRLFKSTRFWRKIQRIAVYENEMKKLLKLAIPYSLTALFECLSEILTIAVIGKLLGTRELSAYIGVHFALSVSTLCIEGPLDSLSIVGSQAIGADESKLAGEYLQIAVVITQLLYLPLMVLWVYFIEDLILWLGFDEETALIAYDYALVVLVNEMFGIVGHGLQYFLEICDFEEFSAIISISQDSLFLVTILSVAVMKNPTLQTIGIIHFAFDVLFFLVTIAIIQWNGWFEDYWPGITGSFALRNVGAVKHLLRTAVPLSIAHILSGGEFEILFVFASFLGPAEVLAWGVFGELWDGIENVTSSLADAAEVRCAYLLGADKPMRAKHSAQKSMLLSFFEGLIVVSFLAASTNFLPGWLTSDSTIEAMLRELIPILCIGVFFDTLGSVSFALVGAQGRLRLATTALFIGSWLLTLPLAYVSASVLNINLEGLAAAVVVGNALSGTTNAFFLLSSDWYEQAAITRKRNKREKEMD